MTVKAILYNGELYDEFNSTEYSEWEDSLDAVIGNTKEERELSEQWITYDFLMGKGIFVQAPKGTRPVPTGISNVPTIPPNTPKATQRREEWTQSRILREQEKLLRERERLVKIKERQLEREARTRQNARPLPTEVYGRQNEANMMGCINLIVGFAAIAMFVLILAILVLSRH